MLLLDNEIPRAAKNAGSGGQVEVSEGARSKGE
jgi:hypothetical protein